MPDRVRYTAMIKAEALRLGFDACGIACASPLEPEARHLSRWLEKGFHGSMHFMEMHLDKRTNPSRLVKDTKSVIVTLLHYYSDKKQLDPAAPVISTYAYGKDYHTFIRKKLALLLRFINREIGVTHGRGFCDSAPVMDKAWAVRAGLGWQGKNSCFISSGRGSYCFIGTLLVDRELHYDTPGPDHCGTCTRCIDACPTQAIAEPHVVNATQCIAYLTIEHREPIPAVFGKTFRKRLFGCDICQEVCPWNRKALPHSTGHLMPLKGLLELSKNDWNLMTEEAFNRQFAGSPLKRSGYKGIRRNLDFLNEDIR